MDKHALLEKIKDKHLDVPYFAKQTIQDGGFRHFIVEELLHNNDIMVYYHCYYILSLASELEPELFYSFWDDFAGLIHHKNSYHRSIGLTLIAHLVTCDGERLMDGLLSTFLAHIDDEKFMTGQCCVQHLKRIVNNRKDLREHIIETLLDIDNKCSYPEKQKELLKYEVLNVFEMVYDTIDQKERLDDFIIQASDSISGKTMKKARQLRKKYNI